MSMAGSQGAASHDDIRGQVFTTLGTYEVTAKLLMDGVAYSVYVDKRPHYYVLVTMLKTDVFLVRY